MLFEDASFEIEAASWTELIGPAGCGKSLLFSVLSLRASPHQGQIIIAGRNLDRLKGSAYAGLRRRIGSCSQSLELLERRTVIENLVLPLVVRGEASRGAEEAERMLDALQLRALRDVAVGQLGSNEQRAVGIMRALIGRPALIIVDAGLDGLEDSLARGFAGLLNASRAQGSTVILLASQRCTFAPDGARHLVIRDAGVHAGDAHAPAAVEPPASSREGALPC
ncbi:MAG: ATP-binding cassette domain-containing protein [Bradymonadaceae bacterium]|nr:ATP-binding cassette domain-containing protein [Lujinxingiaceae bacterium]